MFLRELRWMEASQRRNETRFIINQSLDRSNKKINRSLKAARELKACSKSSAKALLRKKHLKFEFNLPQTCIAVRRLEPSSYQFLLFIRISCWVTKTDCRKIFRLATIKIWMKSRRLMGGKAMWKQECPNHKKAIVINASFLVVFLTLFD